MLAAIDVGTNTVRLLIGDVRRGMVVPQHYVRQVTRLGGGFCPKRGLASGAMERTLFALSGFAAELAAAQFTLTWVVGTADLRYAANRQVFLERVAAQTGLRVEVIAGEEEARLTALGALSVLDSVAPLILVFDIGGGSTEFILAREGRTIWAQSVPLGVVRLVELAPAEQARVIGQSLEQIRHDLLSAEVVTERELPQLQLAGTAGTVTTLAALKLSMVTYDWRRINNQRLERDDLRQLAALLEALEPEARLSLPGMEKGREDLILPGLAIVQKTLEVFEKNDLLVSDFGLLEGILLEA